MARIRSVHPGQWTDERFVTTSPMARLLAIGLRNEADDNGIFEWKPLQLKMRLFPADNCDVPELLEELSATGQVLRYEVAGRPFGIIRNFTKYQSPKYPTFYHPVPSVIPEGYALHSKYLEKLDEQNEGHSGSESSQKERVSPSTSPALPQHSGNRRAEGEERRGEDSRGEGQNTCAPRSEKPDKPGPNPKKPRKAELDFSVFPDDMSQQVLQDWLTMRKGIKAPANTQTVLNEIAKAVEDCRSLGLTPDQVLTMAMLKSWRGLRKDWVANELAKRGNLPRGDAGNVSQLSPVGERTKRNMEAWLAHG